MFLAPWLVERMPLGVWCPSRSTLYQKLCMLMISDDVVTVKSCRA
jgi:hypothetical protein